jgi:chemotaxis protein MotC
VSGRALPCLLAALCSAVSVAPGRAAEDGGLQPYQMVRALEQVQDRIAGGDHASLPMQRKLLEMTDARLRAMTAEELAEPKNRAAFFAYAMNGGNPATFQAALGLFAVDDRDRKLAGAIGLYISGQTLAAQEAFAAVDPMQRAPEVGAYLALIKGSVFATDRAKAAIEFLDKARLLAPGTLVEEAALRRTVAITPALGDPDRFMRASYRYVHAFLRSPYASQFADSFVAGIVAFHNRLDMAEVVELTGFMDPERQKVMFLRIARKAAIDGLADLSTFAAGKAEEIGKDPRATLYSSVATLTADRSAKGPGEAVVRLGGIDPAQLSANDRRLLDAARAVAAGIAAPPAGQERRPAAPGEAPPTIERFAPQVSPPPPDPVHAAVEKARGRLGEIDRMLEATPR